MLVPGLYSDNAEKNFLIDEMYDSVGDVRSPFVQAHFCKDESGKVTLLQIKETKSVCLNRYCSSGPTRSSFRFVIIHTFCIFWYLVIGDICFGQC